LTALQLSSRAQCFCFCFRTCIQIQTRQATASSGDLQRFIAFNPTGRKTPPDQTGSPSSFNRQTMQQQILRCHFTDLISTAPHTQKEHEEETAVAAATATAERLMSFQDTKLHHPISSTTPDCLPASDLF
jgi:hypothetical protein